MLTLSRIGYSTHQTPLQRFVTAGMKTKVLFWALRTNFLLEELVPPHCARSLSQGTGKRNGNELLIKMRHTCDFFFLGMTLQTVWQEKDLLASQQWRAVSMTALQPSKCKWSRRFVCLQDFMWCSLAGVLKGCIKIRSGGCNRLHENRLSNECWVQNVQNPGSI